MTRYASAYEIEVRHAGLNKYRLLRGSNKYEVEQRAAALSSQWNAEWARRQDIENRRSQRLGMLMFKEDMKREAADRTDQAGKLLGSLSCILSDGLRSLGPFDWSILKDRSVYPEPYPELPGVEEAPNAPIASMEKYQPVIGLLEVFLPKRKKAAIDAAAKRFGDDRAEWASRVAAVDARNSDSRRAHDQEVAAWETRRAAFEAQQLEQHTTVDERADAAAAGDEDAVNELLDLTLAALSYPECINANYRIDYNAVTRSCVVDFDLPSPDELPTLRELRFIQAREEFSEKHISEADRGKLYDNVLYQIALRALKALFAGDSTGHLQRATLNGWVDYVDRASGMDERSCILSVAVNRTDIDRIDFERVDPRECFRSLKGVAASKLIGLAPVAPLERPRIVDTRFVESQEIASTINAGVNLAAMDWQDFEHLVRQVFENEFSGPGSEVRVTQASRDGGVDAIVFDPDPIRGGKIVIQAKRYTNTVGVSAVRDLYGTVHNEGATKGILVTTSQYGPDARKFAQDKPITLIDGGNLLHLLEKMGVSARINLIEAKNILSEQ